MPKVVFVVFGPAGTVSRTHRPIGHAWADLAKRLSACCTFHAFDEGTQYDTVVDTRSVLPPRLSEKRLATLAAASSHQRPLCIAVLARIEVFWTTCDAGIACPRIRDDAQPRTRGSQYDAVARLFAHACRSGCRIVVLPEGYFFAGTPGARQPYDQDDMRWLEARLAALTRGHPLALLIAGTVFWRQPAGGRDRIRNTLWAFCDGEVLIGESRPYDKQQWTGEEVQEAARHGEAVLGEQAHACFSWHGLSVCAQICQDSAVGTAGPIDVHVIVGDLTGNALLRHRVGGIGVYADAAGVGCAEDIYRRVAVSAAPLVVVPLDIAWMPLRTT